MKTKHLRVLAAAMGAAFAMMAVLATTAAAAEEPAEGYKQFAGCPTPEENSEITACSRTVIDGGHFQMGSKDVELKKTMTLVGGLLPDGHLTANSEGGLSPVKQQVPGGVIGITGLDWLVDFLGVEALQLYAQTELAGAPTLGANLELPIKVRLINPVLGNECYVGSNASPILLNLTTETTSPPPPNSPITGVPPTFSFDPALEISTFGNGQFVDNSFAAPGANGCVLTLFGFIPFSLNGLVNSQAGLPSAAGKNETRQNFDLELTGQDKVYP